MIKRILVFASFIIILDSCSDSNSELNDRYSELDKKSALMLDFNGVREKITPINTDTASRRSFTDNVVSLMPLNFAFLNNEVAYLNSIKETPENKDMLNKYKDRIKYNLSQQIKIYRLIFIKLSEKNVENWGQLTLEGDNYDIIRQKCDNATQRDALIKFLPDMTDMRFKKIISTYNKSEAITEIQSVADNELMQVKM